MSSPDPEDAHPGDRVTLVGPQGAGADFDGVVCCVHSPGTINALYRPDGDGSWEDCYHQAEYTIATSLTPADTQDGEPAHAYRMGWRDTESN